MLAPADDHTAPSSLRRSQHRTDASGDMRSLCLAFTATCIALLQDRPTDRPTAFLNSACKYYYSLSIAVNLYRLYHREGGVVEADPATLWRGWKRINFLLPVTTKRTELCP